MSVCICSYARGTIKVMGISYKQHEAKPAPDNNLAHQALVISSFGQPSTVQGFLLN